MKEIVRLPGFKTAPQLGRGNEWRYYVVHEYPSCHAYYELRTKNENRRTKDKQKSTDEGRKTKIKDENRRTKIALLGHRSKTLGAYRVSIKPITHASEPRLLNPRYRYARGRRRGSARLLYSPVSTRCYAG